MYLMFIREETTDLIPGAILQQFIIKEKTEKYIRSGILNWLSNLHKKVKIENISYLGRDLFKESLYCYVSKFYYGNDWKERWLYFTVEITPFIEEPQLEKYLTSDHPGIRNFAKDEKS